MISVFISFGIVHAVCSAVFFIVGKRRHAAKEKSLLAFPGRISLSDITVIIPFRDEVAHLPHLIRCILESEKQPKHILFVDDNSADNGAKIVLQATEKNANIALLSSQNKGKKAAIRTGISSAQTKYILTLDADVIFEKTYFSNLELVPTSDLIILPVQMKGKGWKQLFEMDYLLSNSLNAAANGWSRPVLGSGANLLFHRETFLELDSYEQHKSIASGDDAFLISDFQKNGKKVILVQNKQFEVTTDTPESWKLFINQRIRWIKKTPKVKDPFANALGLFTAFGSANYLFLLFLTLQSSRFYLSLIVVCTYFLIDLILFSAVLSPLKKGTRWFWVGVYLLIAPLYHFLIGFLSFFVRPTWKGRS